MGITSDAYDSYMSSGSFTVEFITSNSFGSDTITYSNLIQVNLTNTPPIAPSCTPTTGLAGSIGNYGITEFNFGNFSNLQVLLLKDILILHVILHYFILETFVLRGNCLFNSG